jgi:uncharacterized protein (DUF433 family)
MKDWQEFISSDENILLGKPCIKGTRISVDLILELFSNEWSIADILKSYPSLSVIQIKAVFFYLRDCMQEEMYFPISKEVV